nr:RidA family protein [Sphingomonas sp. CDS-1]
MTLQNLKQQSINPPELQIGSDMFHLSQAKRVGDIIWLSGQVGVDASLVPPEGLEAQTRLTFENIKTILEAAGASMADIVEMTIFFTDLTLDMEPFFRVKDEYILAPYPAITGVGVTQLAIPGLLLEIRVVAVAGSGQS